MKKKKILILENDLITILLLEKIFEYLNLEVNIKVTSSGQEALNLCRQESFDLLIIDIKVAELNGDEFVKIYREELNGKANVIAFTAINNFHLNSNAHYFDDIIIKPAENIINVMREKIKPLDLIKDSD